MDHAGEGQRGGTGGYTHLALVLLSTTGPPPQACLWDAPHLDLIPYWSDLSDSELGFTSVTLIQLDRTRGPSPGSDPVQYHVAQFNTM